MKAPNSSEIQSIGRKKGFTLLEVMIVVAIIAGLAVLAVPSFLRSYRNAISGRISNDMSVLRGAVETFHIEHSAYPNAGDNLLPGTFPSDLRNGKYIDPEEIIIYERDVPMLGGRYQFDYDPSAAVSSTYKAAIVIANTTADSQLLEMIDAKLDDDNLASGSIRKDGHNLIWIME